MKYRLKGKKIIEKLKKKHFRNIVNSLKEIWTCGNEPKHREVYFWQPVVEGSETNEVNK